MAGMLGAATDRLREIALRFGGAADTLGGSARAVSSDVNAVEWLGADADAFRTDVDEVVRADLEMLATMLRERDTDLVGQADDQDATSDPAGRGGGAATEAANAGGEGKTATPASGPLTQAAIDELRGLAGDPNAVADALDGLSDAQLEQLAHDEPELMGTLEGAPYWARDIANRARLDAALEVAESTGSEHLDDLQQVRSVLDRSPESSLAQLDLTDPERVYAAVAVGDLDTASNVAYIVPGINTTVEGHLAGHVDSAMNVRDEIALSGSGDVADVATVAWIGYDSGNMLSVPFDGKAQEGGDRLGTALDGFTAVRPDDTVDLGVIGHSYGSTAAADALSDGTQHGVDNFISMGSAGFIEARDTNGWWPGGGEITPGDFGSTDVSVTEASPDHVADIGRVVSGRIDPREAGFTEFSSDADGGRPGTTGHGYATRDDQVGYLGPGSNSLYNIGQILNGNGAVGVDDAR